MALTQITEKGIKDGEILNADINASAAIAGSKIDPTFTSTVNVTNNLPEIFLTDANTSNARGRINANAGGLLLGADNDNAAADSVISFAVDGSEKARINSSGNVGIGTTAPSELFTVNGADKSALIRTSSATGTAKLKFEADGTNYGGVGLENTAIVFRCSNNSSPTERMRIDSAGKLTVTSTSTAANDSEPVATFTTQGHSQIRLNGDGNQWALMALDSSAAGNNFIIYDKNNSAERIRIDSSGNLVVGGTSAQASDSATLMADGEVTAAGFYFTNNIGSPMNSDGIRRATTNTIVFDTNSTERMRINSSGHLILGATSTDSNSSTGVRIFQTGSIHSTRSSEFAYVGRRSDSDGGLFLFRRDSSNVGSISVNSSSTAYNTSSDYRLKENVAPISDGITRLKTLKPSRFNFKSNKDLTVDGFLAHEVTAVPEAVTGTKDAVATEDSEEAKKGDPIYQQIDQSKLVPLLTAALQEEISKRETLETRVAALEAA